MDRFKAFVREKGLYLLCLAVAFAATAAGILALRRIVGHLTGQPDAASGLVEQDTLWEQPDTAVEKSVVDIPKPTLTPTPAPTATPQPTPQPQRAAESQVPQQAVRPRPAWYGKAVTAFSGDELVYNATLGDWRTHNGADYTVPEGKAITPAVGQCGGDNGFLGHCVAVLRLAPDAGRAGGKGPAGHDAGGSGQPACRGACWQPPAFGVLAAREISGPGGGDGRELNNR